MSTVKPATSYSAILGRVLQSRRKQQGVDQATVAAALGLTQGAYSRLERGTSVISAEQLHTVSAALDSTPTELIRCADAAVAAVKERGVQVVPSRRGDDGVAMITAAALGVLLAAVLLKK